ncbi:zinc finger protein 154-like isoform X2 [Sphaerodactylus townsendi]|uniref:zinc finger protein 154-like isoform X2 n=1 Tax=Sphaerodactylus townsendi TaxID=933632 RepID=UPI002026ACC3|nr:zinc finger protein 154-like isoform X2 [Sphaerodactylus townsendi]
MSGFPWLEEESSSSTSARRRSTISFEEVAVFFKDEEWTLLDPCQRNLFWEVMEENYEMVASLGKDISQKVLQTLDRSTLHIVGVQGPVFPRGGERKIWNMEFHVASLLSCFPQLEGEFGFCTFTGRSFTVSFEEVAVFFAEEEWALLDPGQRKLCWEVMKENHETLGSLVAEMRETVWEKESGKVVVEEDYGLQMKVKYSDQVVPKEECRSKTEAKQTHRKKLAGYEGGNHHDELWKRKRRHQDPMKKKGFSCKFSVKTQKNLMLCWKTYNHLKCGMNLDCSSKLATHNRNQAGEQPYKCIVCGKSFLSKSHLTVHHRVHTGEKPYKCLVCEKSFSRNGTLTAHQRVHTGEKPYKCLVCEKSFSQNSTLTAHQKVHTGEKPYKCLECGKTFAWDEGLNKHERLHTGKKLYQCMECGKSFSQNGKRTTHQKAHAGEKPYKCLECGKSFSSKSHLTVHHRVHTGEKPYKCLVCGKSFSQNSSLITHQRVHTGEKPYKCLECGRNFSTNDALTKHQRVHAGGKPYKCLMCGKSFSRKDTLAGHQKIHRGESILTEYRKSGNRSCRLPLHPNKSLSVEAATVFLEFNWPPNSPLFLLPCLLAPKVM